MDINLKAKPFYLEDDDILWVKNTLASMTEDDKLRHLFCLVLYNDSEEYCNYLAKEIRPGGFMNRVMPVDQCINAISRMQSLSKIPMLVAANLESGGSGIIKEGTNLGRQMQIAATDDVAVASHLGTVCGKEGSAVGANWSFAPIIDIDYNWRNPVTNLRTFGSDPKRVRGMGVAYVEALQSEGVAATIKHFPGDGCDERDQHVSLSVNSLSCEEWDNTYGKAYSACIEAGAKTVMVGHIMQPSYTRYFSPETKDEDMLPASISKELVSGLLRKKLGFNGLVITDSTAMAGLATCIPRKTLVPLTIAAGCDMFLFTKNLEEDIEFMKQGFYEGVFTEERLDEAVIRILALKASLGLHKAANVPTPDDAKQKIGLPEYRTWAKECAKKSITLVKEEKGIFPITPERFKRVLFCPLDNSGNTAADNTPNGRFKRTLEKEGFEVTVFEPQQVTEGSQPSVNEMAEKYDIVIYSAAVSSSYQPVSRLRWSAPQGANIPTLCHTIPTVFISLQNPYHLVDVPHVRTYINCYNNSLLTIEALVDKLVGRDDFTGISPIDPFCGKWDAKVSFGGECQGLKNK